MGKGKSRKAETAKDYLETIEAILTVIKFTSVAALIFGGWGLLQYCVENDIPFPVEMSSLVMAVGVVAGWHALIGSGFLLFPMLGKTGGLGKGYSWLMTLPKKKRGKKNKKGKLIGLVVIPAAIFMGAFSLSVALSPLKDGWDYYLLVGMLLLSLVSIGATISKYFKPKDWPTALLGSVYLVLLIMMWLLIALLMLVKGMSLSGISWNAAGEWLALIVMQLFLLWFLYKTMLPGDGDMNEARKNWGMIVFTIFAFLMMHPYWAARVTEKSLLMLKRGGEYEVSYTLTEKYCNQTTVTICDQSNYQTSKLKLMLDSGDRLYVRLVDVKDNEEKGKLYMLPSKEVIGQEPQSGKG